MKNYKINVKKVLSNICIIFVFLVVFNFTVNIAFGNKEIKTKSMVVKNNDTLWNIAKDVCDNSNENLNIQNVVIQIKNINNLNSSNIYVGQTLEIPIYE